MRKYWFEISALSMILLAMFVNHADLLVNRGVGAKILNEQQQIEVLMNDNRRLIAIIEARTSSRWTAEDHAKYQDGIETRLKALESKP